MPPIPALDACHFEFYVDVVCFHPESDDCFNVKGHGPTRAEAYGGMLDDLYEHYVDRFDCEEEASAFYAAICAAQTGARTERAARIQALASDALFTEEVPF